MPGVTVTLLGQAPIFGIAFFGIDSGKIVASKLFKPVVPGQPDDLKTLKWAIATCISGGVTALLLTPTERIKCLIQIQAQGTTHPHYKGTMDCAKILWQNGGIANMYRGLGVTYLRGIILVMRNGSFGRLI